MNSEDRKFFIDTNFLQHLLYINFDSETNDNKELFKIRKEKFLKWLEESKNDSLIFSCWRYVEELKWTNPQKAVNILELIRYHTIKSLYENSITIVNENIEDKIIDFIYNIGYEQKETREWVINRYKDKKKRINGDPYIVFVVVYHQCDVLLTNDKKIRRFFVNKITDSMFSKMDPKKFSEDCIFNIKQSIVINYDFFTPSI